MLWKGTKTIKSRQIIRQIKLQKATKNRKEKNPTEQNITRQFEGQHDNLIGLKNITSWRVCSVVRMSVLKNGGLDSWSRSSRSTASTWAIGLIPSPGAGWRGGCWGGGAAGERGMQEATKWCFSFFLSFYSLPSFLPLSFSVYLSLPPFPLAASH